MQTPENSPARYLSDRGVAARYNIGKSTVWYWAKNGNLPKPHKIGENTTRWKVAELYEFDEKRPTNMNNHC